jgi:ABC-type transport system involved in cytochrome c biogenesis permease component
MKKSDLYRISSTLLYRECLIITRDISGLVCNLLFLAISFFLFYFILQNHCTSNISLAYGLMLITTIFVILASDSFSIDNDYHIGILEQFFLLPIHPEICIIIKICAGILRQMIVQFLFWSFIWTISFNEMQSFFSLSIGINYFLFLLYILIMVFFIRSIGLCVHQHKSVMMPILLFPFIFPQIVFSVLSVNDQVYMLLSLSLLIVIAPLLVILSVFGVRNAVNF